MEDSISSCKAKKTGFAFLWMHLTDEPFIALFALLGFFLKKDLNASTLQLSIFATVSPVIALFSFYWSSTLTRNQRWILPNLIGAWVLGRLPFLFFPCFNSVWYLIFASAIYHLFHRAGTPALIEILKTNLSKPHRENLFSLVYLLSFAESILLGLFIGKILNLDGYNWQTLLVITAATSMSSIVFQCRIPIMNHAFQDKTMPPKLHHPLIQPWKDCVYLMRTYREFAKFQWGFMIGGFGLMLMMPAVIIYYADILHLSHEDLAHARYIWMGFGVLLSTFLWKKSLQRHSPTALTSLILTGFALFPIFLLLAKTAFSFLYIAFFFYGIAQAGSHLLWHLSGTLFASEEESSSKYTGTNVLMVGIRGIIGPALGGLLASMLGPTPVLFLGGTICILGACFMQILSLKKVPLTDRILR